MNPETDKIKPSTQQISTSLSGETILLNHSQGQYFGLDEVGTEVWNIISEKPTTLNEIVQKISAIYDIDEQECKKDIEELLVNLFNEKLIEIVT